MISSSLSECLRARIQLTKLLPAIAVGQPGRVDIAWYTSDGRPPDSHAEATFGDEHATWTVALARATDGLSANPHFFQSRVSSDVVHVGDFHKADSPWAPFADFLGLAIDSHGLANVAYNHDTFGQLLVIHAKETKPDLQVTNITATNNQAPQGEKVTITATIANTGTDDADLSQTEFLLDDTTVLA